MATLHPPLDFAGVLSESKRVINAHSRHFLALSVLFLLPLSFSLTVLPTLHQTLSFRPGIVQLRSPPGDSDPTSSTETLTLTLQIALAYLLLVSFLSLCASGSVTFSVLHGFYGRPVKLASAVKSLTKSLIPLLVTSTFMNLLVLGVCFVFGLLMFLFTRGIGYLGFQVSNTSPYFISLSMICLVGLALVLLYLQVNWALADVVVVAESTWGIHPLRRSTSLVKGMRRLSLSLVLFFGFFIGMLVSISSTSSLNLPGSGTGGSDWKSVGFIVQIVVTSALISLLMLHYLAATTVFYMYCKAMQGELAAEIAEEFSREYISLPFDAEKVPHIVSVI